MLAKQPSQVLTQLSRHSDVVTDLTDLTDLTPGHAPAYLLRGM